MLTVEIRKAIYEVAAAIGALLVIYGLVEPEQVEVWLQVVSSALLLASSTLAALNTHSTPPSDAD